jgi:hypothetical protein
MLKSEKLKYAFGALTEREYDLIMAWEPTAIKELKQRFGMSYEQAKSEIQRIKDKLKAYQDHEERQQNRAERMNIAHISAAIHGTKELLIMQNL